jgi:hypothetical protein
VPNDEIDGLRFDRDLRCLAWCALRPRAGSYGIPALASRLHDDRKLSEFFTQTRKRQASIKSSPFPIKLLRILGTNVAYLRPRPQSAPIAHFPAARDDSPTVELQEQTMRTYFGRVLRAIAAAAAAVLCSLSPAQAAFYSGAWDPLYGMPFLGGTSPIGYNLGWRGEVQVFVPDSCAFGSGPRNFGAADPCSQNSYVQSATVDFYDNDNPSLTKGTVTFTTSSMSINALHFLDNELLSLATLPSSWDQAAWISPEPPVSPYFSLLFLDEATSNFLRAPYGFVWLGELLGLRDEIPANYAGPLLLSHPSRDFDDPIESLDELVATLLAFRSISVSDVESEAGRPRYPNGSLFALAAPPISVPEPSSLTLIALALLAIGWLAHFRRRA